MALPVFVALFIVKSRSVELTLLDSCMSSDFLE